MQRGESPVEAAQRAEDIHVGKHWSEFAPGEHGVGVVHEGIPAAADSQDELLGGAECRD
jgi:hypothetical protein